MRRSALLLAAVLACACGRDAAERGRGMSESEYDRMVDPALREEYYWAVVGTGRCPGPDAIVASSGAEPAAERCDAERFGTVAVCWDGARYRRPDASAGAGCAYTSARRAECADGPRPGAPSSVARNPGRLWECVRTDAE